MTSSHSIGTLTQGRLLVTEFTSRWNQAQLAAGHEAERRRLFTQFSSLDEGRSRKFVAEAASEADARRLAACWNACLGISTDILEATPLFGGIQKEALAAQPPAAPSKPPCHNTPGDTCDVKVDRVLGGFTCVKCGENAPF